MENLIAEFIYLLVYLRTWLQNYILRQEQLVFLETGVIYTVTLCLMSQDDNSVLHLIQSKIGESSVVYVVY